MGFSDGLEADLYLPVDHSADAPSAEDQVADPDSLLSVTKQLTALRHAYEDLQADGPFEVLRAEADAPFVYKRGKLILAVNPGSEAAVWTSDLLEGRKVVYRIGSAETAGGRLELGPQSFAVLEG